MRVHKWPNSFNWRQLLQSVYSPAEVYSHEIQSAGSLTGRVELDVMVFWG